VTELRLAARYLLRAPGYALAVVLTLAVATGANTAIVAAVYGVLLKPTPIRDPQALVMAWDSDPQRSLPVIEISYRQFEDWTARSRSFASAAAIGSTTWRDVIDEKGTATRVSLAGVSSGFFDTLGVTPLLGRGFHAGDDAPGAPKTVILSHGLWTRLFGADPAVVGRTIRMEEPCVVVGVMPEGLDFPRGTEVWRPVVPILVSSGTQWNTDALDRVGVLFVVARLRPGVDRLAAADEVQRAAAAGASRRYGTSVVLISFAEHFFGPVRKALFALLAAVTLLLLIACANVSGLMLSRIAAHRRDDAVRAALGATRGVLARRWLAEAALLFAIGGALGLLTGRWLLDVLVALAPPGVAHVAAVTIDARIALFTLASTAVAALLCGGAAIAHKSTVRLADVHGSRTTDSPGTLRARSALVVLQIAFSLVLIVTATLVVRSFANLRAVDAGFLGRGVLSFGVEPRGLQQRPVNAWMEDLIREIEAVRGVEAAGAVYLRPLAFGPIGQETFALLEGQPDDESARRQNPTLNYQVATPGYFGAMRIRLVRGRLFGAADVARAQRVAIVGESAAKRLWPGQDPVGRRMLLPSFVPGDRVQIWRTVVGVVSDVSYRGLTDFRLDVYDAAAQAATPATDVVIRASGDPLRLASEVQAIARRLDPSVVVDRVTTMDAVIAGETAPWRFSSWVLGLFAAMAFLLAGLGLFALVAVEVVGRRHELAVRMALGAGARDVVKAVMRPAVGRIAAGLALGIPAAAALARAIRALLFGVSPADATSYALGAVLIMIAVGVAAFIPARRATAIDPRTLLDG
jgi:putative ABC transport system permease protein